MRDSQTEKGRINGESLQIFKDQKETIQSWLLCGISSQDTTEQERFVDIYILTLSRHMRTQNRDLEVNVTSRKGEKFRHERTDQSLSQLWSQTNRERGSNDEGRRV